MKSAQGKKELLKFQTGAKITAREAIKAKCYECTGNYEDGREDCGITTCPLYGYMPYGSRKYAPTKRGESQVGNLIKARAAKSKTNTI